MNAKKYFWPYQRPAMRLLAKTTGGDIRQHFLTLRHYFAIAHAFEIGDFFPLSHRRMQNAILLFLRCEKNVSNLLPIFDLARD